MGEDYARRIEQAVAGLIDSVRQFDEAALRQAPDEDEWSATQIMAHIAAVLPFWAYRARGVAASNQDGIDFSRTPAEWEQRRVAVDELVSVPFEELIARLEGNAAEAAALLRTIPDRRWSRTGRHWAEGELTVAGIVETLTLGHIEEHAEQAHAAAIAGARRG